MATWQKLSHVVISFTLLLAFAASAQTTGFHSQHQTQQFSSGTTWAMQAMAALTGGTQVNNVTESGSVVWTIGDNQGSGSINMQSSGNTASQITLSTSAGNRSETRGWASDGSGPIGHWTDLDGEPHQMSQHNCWSDAVWFFPALSMLSDYSDPNLVFVDLGPEQHHGHNVEHIQVYRTSPGLPPDVAAQLEQITTVNYYLDSQTALPVAITFSLHGDHDVNRGILTEIVFTQYQQVSGVQVPFQVTRLLNGSPMFQITITSVVPNG